MNSGSLVLAKEDGKRLDLVGSMKPLRTPGLIGTVSAQAVVNSSVMVPGWVCALRKTEEAIRLAHARIRREASRQGRRVQPATLEMAKSVILFTTVPECDSTDKAVLE